MDMFDEKVEDNEGLTGPLHIPDGGADREHLCAPQHVQSHGLQHGHGGRVHSKEMGHRKRPVRQNDRGGALQDRR